MLIPYIIPKTRKGMKIVMIIVIAVWTAAAVIVFSAWSADQENLKKNGQPSFNTLSEAQLKDGLIVKGAIDMALDYYAEDYETNNGVRSSDKSEALYYIVPIYGTAQDGSITINYLITYKAVPEEFTSMDDIVRQTWSDTAELSTYTVENAKIVDLPEDIKQYYTEWAQDPQFYEGGSFIDWCIEYNVFGTGNNTKIESKLVPYMIEETYTAGTDLSSFWAFLILDVLSIVVLLFLIFHKAPIKGVVETPQKEDFSKLREMDGE